MIRNMLSATAIVAACVYCVQPITSVQELSSVTTVIQVGPVGSIGKKLMTQDIRLRNLKIKLDAQSITPVERIIDIAGASQSPITLTFDSLQSNKQWHLHAETIDTNDSIVHFGDTTFFARPGRSETVYLYMYPEYSRLRIQLTGLSDSANRCALFIDGTLRQEIKSSAGNLTDTIVTSFDYLAASKDGIAHDLLLKVYGIAWGIDTVLYSGSQRIVAVAGRDTAYQMELDKLWIDTPFPSKANVTIRIGPIGDTKVNAKPTGEISYMFQTCIDSLYCMANSVLQTADGKMILVGNYGKDEVYVGGDGIFIIKLDKDLQVLAEKRLTGISTWLKNGSAFTPDGGLVIGGRSGNSAYVVKLDDSMNQEWNYTVKRDLTDGNCVTTINPIKEGGYLVGILNGSPLPQGYAVRISEEGKEVWRKEYYIEEGILISGWRTGYNPAEIEKRSLTPQYFLELANGIAVHLASSGDNDCIAVIDTNGQVLQTKLLSQGWNGFSMMQCNSIWDPFVIAGPYSAAICDSTFTHIDYITAPSDWNRGRVMSYAFDDKILIGTSTEGTDVDLVYELVSKDQGSVWKKYIRTQYDDEISWIGTSPDHRCLIIAGRKIWNTGSEIFIAQEYLN